MILSCLAVIFAVVYIVQSVVVPSIVYKDAIVLIAQEKYQEAYYKLHKCKKYKDSADILNNFVVVYEQSTYTSSDGKISTTDYVYDEAGRCISEKTRNSNSVSSFEFQYNEEGCLEKEIETMADGRIFITEFLYKNKRCINEYHSSPQQDYKYTVEYTYDNKGQCIKETNTDDDDYVGIKEYQYDDKGNLLKMHHSRSWGGDGFVEYFYNSEGMCVEERCWFAQDETPYETVEYVRNDMGEWIKRITRDRAGDIEETVENYYDDYGNRYKYTITDSIGDQDVNEYSGLLVFYNNK